jgi:hypothetical protein
MLDQTTDKNHAGLYQLSQCVEIPAFVKEAAFSDTSLIQDLPATSFADPDRRQYPMHSAPDTWLSCAYFTKFAAAAYDSVTYDRVKENLLKGCAFWRIQPPKLHTLEKRAAAEVEYADDQRVFEKVAVNTPADVETLANDLTARRERFPWAMRHKVARQLLKLARDLQASLPHATVDELQKMAGLGVGSASRMLRQLEIRRVAVNNVAVQERIQRVQKMAAALQRQDLLSPEFTEKVARLTDYIDRLCGLHRQYSDEVRPPEQLFRYTLQDRDLLHKSAVRLPDGSLISEKEADSPAIGQLLQHLTGRVLDKVAARETLRQLSPRECRLVTQALANA